MAVMQRDWKAVRKGAIYCAPACGGGCTKAAYDAAVRKSRALVKRMGKGWVPRVWENLGWFYEVHKGVLSLHPNHYCGGQNFTAYLNTNPQFIWKDKNPKAAVAGAIKALDAHIASVKKQRKDIGTI